MALRGGPLRSSASAVSKPGWRTEDFLRFETNFLEEGVVQGEGGELAVTECGDGANMSVDVAAGIALIECTSTLLTPNETFKTWLRNDDVENVLVPTADPTNPRKDRIVAVFDMTIDPNTVASNNVSIELIMGTPAGSPVLPALPANAIHLKTVNVAAGATSILDANLADTPSSVTLSPDVFADVCRISDLNALISDLEATDTGNGASLVGIEDANGHFTSDNVEGALNEIGVSLLTALEGGKYGDGSDGALNVTTGTTTIDASAAVNGFLVKNYTSFNVSAGATLAFSNVPAGGIVFVPLVQGAWSCPGTIDLSNCGSDGGAQIQFSKTANGESSQVGNKGTVPSNALSQERRGDGGGIYLFAGNQSTKLVAGGGGSANAYSDGSNAADKTGSGQTATGGAKGIGITAQLVAMAAQYGITICPGAGGSTGGIINKVEAYGSGTYVATAAPGTKGGGSLLAMVGGNFSFTGTLKMGSANCTNSSVSKGTATGSNYNNCVAAGGASAGAAGNAVIFVSKLSTITNSATVQASPGTAGTGAADKDTNGTGAGGTVAAGDGGVSASGSMQVFAVL